MHVNRKYLLAFLLLSTTVVAFGQSAMVPSLSSLPVPQGTPGYESTGIPLKFRDSVSPLTIGEMSDMEAKKAEVDFLAKHGYSNVPAAKPQSTARVAAVAARPILTLLPMSVWGKAPQLIAEVRVNGILMRLRGGETLIKGSVVVTSIVPAGIQIALTTSSKVKNKSVTKTTNQLVVVGENSEVAL